MILFSGETEIVKETGPCCTRLRLVEFAKLFAWTASAQWLRQAWQEFRLGQSVAPA
jgi:hypothetical protein